MPTFSKTLVFDNVGGVARYLRNGRINIVDAATGVLPTTLTQGGVPVTFLMSDAKGSLTFDTNATTVVATTPDGRYSDRWTAQSVIEAAATMVLSNDAGVAAYVGNPASLTRVAGDAVYPLRVEVTPTAPAPSGGNDQTALQAFLTANAGKRVQLRPGAAYSLGGTLNVAAGADIDARGATITQTTSNTPIFTATGIDGFTVRNGKFVGKATDYADTTASYPAAVIRATTGSKNIRLIDCDCRGFAGAAVYASGVTGLRISGCTVVGVGNGGGAGTYTFTAGTSKDNCGVIMDGTCAKVWILNNEFSYSAQGVLGGVNTDIIIDSNDIHDIGGQHGVYLNNTVRLKMTNNTVRTTAANGLKVQLSTFGNGDCTEVLIQGNLTVSTTGSGIHCTLSSSAGADRFKRIAIVDNILVNVGVADGIMLQNADGFRVDRNMVRTTQGTGIRNDDCINGSILDNLTRDTYDQGIRVNGSVTTSPVAGDNIRIARNRIMEPGVNNNAATEFGISTSGCGNLTFAENWITDAGGNMRYGIYVAGGTQTTMDFIGNRSSGASDYGFRGIAATAARTFRENSFAGSLGAILNLPTGYAAIAAPTAPSATYVQAEATSMKTAVDAIRAVLTANGFTP